MSICLKSKRGKRRSIQLKQVKVRLIRPNEKESWDELMRSHHYLSSSRLGGRQLKYVAECHGQCLALISFSSCSYHLAPRDRWIGWDQNQLEKRRDLVVQNSRFLVMPGVNEKNLASKILSLCTNRLSADWENNYGHPVLLVETFVDLKYSGTSYSASGWTRLGETKGFYRRHAQTFTLYKTVYL
jgi:hypothetical protein